VAKAIVQNVVDRRFASIPPYPTLRVFSKLSAVSQWTGAEQKSILRQILPVFVPLLEEIGTTAAKEAIRFIRATVDFITLAMYESHDDNTLRYFELALYRMNQHKEVFRKYRNPKAEEEARHFNFPKWHALTHYPQMIRLYGCAPNWDTSHPEHKHHTYVKEGFRRTNRKNGWEDQLMDHHHRGLNMLALQDLLAAPKRKSARERLEETEEPVLPAEAVPIAKVFGLPKPHRRRMQDMWWSVGNVAELLDEEDAEHFRQAMAVFVRESRLVEAAAAPSTTHRADNPDRIEADATWVDDCLLQLHQSIKCRKASGDDPEFGDATERNYARCARNWANTGKPRRDWVWVQEFGGSGDGVAFQGRLPVRIRLIFTVKDTGAPIEVVKAGGVKDDDEDDVTYPQYSGIYVDVYEAKLSGGMADPDHGMTTIKPLPAHHSKGVLRGRRVYSLAQVYHTIHVVPVDERSGSKNRDMYINNTADWATYNFIYNEDWEVEVMRKAVESKRRRMLAVAKRERAAVKAAKEKRLAERLAERQRRKNAAGARGTKRKRD
jgi:hypothetical protein